MKFAESLLMTVKLLAMNLKPASSSFLQKPTGGSTMSRGRASVGAARRITDDSELLTRTSWVDAGIAYRQVSKGRAYGNRRALWLRWHLQTHLYNLGCFTEKHCGKVLFLGLLLLSLCCVGLKTASLETNVERLWVEAGGRLQKEIKYTQDVRGEGSGITFEMIIQTPKTGHNNLLSVNSLLRHYEAIRAATKITVDMYGITWTFKDLCFTSNFPSFDNNMFDRILDNIVPCTIITPLDCFWEGSKLLGPSHGIFVPGYHPSVKWTNLNPLELVRSLKKLGSYFPSDAIEDVLKRAGIGAAYQDRPCLNPNDMECPSTAPNRKSKIAPDVGVELTGGCSGFATKYMHWEEELIVGGVHKNKTGHIVRAEALQSIIQLMGEKEMFDYYKETYKVHGVDWTAKKAKLVLEAWQRKFTKVVLHATNASDSSEENTIHPFSSMSMLDILAEFSQISVVRVSVGYILMLIYACFSLWRWADAVKSQSGVAMAGVILIAFSVAGGLGLCSVIGIKFNASTTQIVPFLALGLGVDDMFFIVHIFGSLNTDGWSPSEEIGECLKRTGVSMLLTSVTCVCAFFTAAIIPIPALRAFVLQAGVLVIFNVATILLIFPAVLSIDLIRKRQNRVDVFCCITGSTNDHVIEMRPQQRQRTPPPDYSETAVSPPNYSNILFHHSIARTDSDGTRPMTELAPPSYEHHGFRNNAVAPAPPGALPPSGSLPPSASNSRQCLAPGDDRGTCLPDCTSLRRNCHNWSLTWFAKNVYAPLLEKTPIKIFVVVTSLIMLVLCIVGVVRVKEGLDLTDVVPKNTNEYSFLEAQSKYFGFYNFYAVTKDNFDYAKGQELLYSYHEAFQHISKIIKKEDGSLPDFWLKLFRDWLKDVQEAFHRDFNANCITMDGWHPNATDEGILGYKLMVQTGDIDDPIDKNRGSQLVLGPRLHVYSVCLQSRLPDLPVETSLHVYVFHGHLVGDNGIIYVSGFYTYLTAWTSNDALAYTASQASFYPQPREWFHVAVDKILKIEKSQPLVYAQLPFYLHDMADTEEITSTIKKIREICDLFTERGLPNYPSGIPFTFWEQYLTLRFYLMMSLLSILGAIFVVLALVLVNLWAAVIMVAVLSMIVVELLGFMGLIGIKLSAVPAVILVVSVGIGVEFTVHLCLGFLTSIGSRNKRMRMSLEHVFAPVINGAISTLLGVVMLAAAEFDFIVKYFFVVLSMLMVIGTLNGLVLLPVLLSILGPPAEVTPSDKTDKLSPPTPEPSPPPRRRSRGLTRHHGYPRVPSDISLTTITEESSQYSSHEIVVQPQIVVETNVPSTIGVVSIDDGSPRNTSTSDRGRPTAVPQTRHIATVRTTTKVKVELHTTLPGAVEQEHSYYKSRRRKDVSDSDSDCSTSSV